MGGARGGCVRAGGGVSEGGEVTCIGGEIKGESEVHVVGSGTLLVGGREGVLVGVGRVGGGMVMGGSVGGVSMSGGIG